MSADKGWHYLKQKVRVGQWTRNEGIREYILTGSVRRRRFETNDELAGVCSRCLLGQRFQ